MIFIPKNNKARLAGGPSDLLGIFEAATFAVEKIEVEPGDRFVMFTDGLLKQLSIKAELDTLVEIAQKHRDYSLKEMMNKMWVDIQATKKQDDDQTFLVFEV